jgi:hypothetical protein
MPDTPKRKAEQEERGDCFAILLEPAGSSLRASDGREVPFTRAVLSLHNTCAAELIDPSLHVTLGQEGGTVQDVTHVLSGLSERFPSGRTVSWDVYDLLLPAHPGTASKIHMFGYRAALNWRFDLAVWVEYRLSTDSPPVRTSPSRWVFRWSVPDPSSGAVVLTIEEGKD